MRRLLLPGGVVLAGVLLAGCAADASDPQTTATLQDGVVEIAESAASGDHDAALSSLDTLAQDVDDALVAGDIDGSRAVAIRDAIDVVRADLETLAAPEPSPSPTQTPYEPVQEVATEPPAEEEAPPAPEAPATEAPEQETPEPETEAPEPETEAPEPEVPEPEVTEPENPGNGNGDQGNGNGNQGNGNGNGNNGNGNGNQGKGNGKK